jgi:hypothetical protein
MGVLRKSPHAARQSGGIPAMSDAVAAGIMPAGWRDDVIESDVEAAIPFACPRTAERQ